MSFTTNNAFRICIKAGLGFITCMLLISVVASLLVFDTHAKYPNVSTLQHEELKSASQFLRRISKQLINTKRALTVHANETEINNAIAFVSKSYASLSGSVSSQAESALFSLSFQIPYFGNRFYLNLQAKLLTSPHGLVWSEGYISSYRLSDTQTRWVFKKAVQVLLGKRYGSNIMAGVKRVDIQNKTITVAFSPPKNLQQGFAKAAQRISSYSGQSLDFETARVQHYLDFLVDMTRALPKENVSTDRYIRALLMEAKTQSETKTLPPKNENLSAIFALSIQVAPGVFRHFIEGLKVNRLNATPQPLLTLERRQDLAKHFIVSGALHILAEKGLSFSIGEAKEILDLHSGGSGFSFADIAADLSGIRFTELAIESNKSAAFLQRYGANALHETDFFPSIAQLPEGLNEANFQARYVDVNSEQYLALIQEIQRRIDALNLYSAPIRP